MPTTPPAPPPVRRLLAVVLLAGLLTASACSSGGSSGDGGRSPEETLDLAKQTLDETAGVHIEFSTDELPADVNGANSGSGVGTHQPNAFDGTVNVQALGQSLDVPVVAVGGKTYAKVAMFGPGWHELDTEDYGVTDPSRLMDPDDGFSTILDKTKNLAEGDQVRGGVDNKEVLTTYSGTVPGSVVRAFIPTATGEFAADYLITEGGELRQAVLTGRFYGGTPKLSYTVDLTHYGTGKTIKAP